MPMISISHKSQVLLILLSFVDHIYKGNIQLQLKVSEHKDVTFHIQVYRPALPKFSPHSPQISRMPGSPALKEDLALFSKHSG